MTTTVQDSSKRVSKKALVAGSLAGAMALIGSLAYFTDRVETSVSATAGTVDLALEANWQDINNFNPGDKADLAYTISNDGNKSVDVRERLVVKSSVAMDAADQAEFEIYHADDVEADAYGAYAPKADADPIATGADRVVSADESSITYEIDQYTLNGTGANAEVEDGIDATNKESSYVLVFKGDANNDFQGANVTVDLVAEAKQHQNTGDDTWTTVSTDSVTVGGAAMDVVPER